MADPLLTSLCSICHISEPKYKCPRCDIRTCSLACIRKHKAWSECSGKRDPTVYKPAKQLRTAAGIDHDYNFLHGLETTMQRTEKTLVEDQALVRADEMRKQPLTVKEVKWKTERDGKKRKVVITRELKETKTGRTLEKFLATRLKKIGVQMLCAPQGMQRQRENKTSFNRKRGLLNWQVEWLRLQDGGDKMSRIMDKTMEDVPFYKAYHVVLEEHSRMPKSQQPQQQQQQQQAPGKPPPRSGRPFTQVPHTSIWNTAAQMVQDPSNGRWAEVTTMDGALMWPTEKDKQQREAFDYYLASARQKPGQPKALTRLAVDDCFRDVLQNTTVLEYPTIYVLRHGGTLPPGFVLGGKARKDASQGAKRKDAPGKKGRNAKRRKQASDLEEGEVGSDDGEDDDAASSVGPGGNDEGVDDGTSVGLEAGDVLAEESFGEDDDEEDDDDSETSSSGSDTSDDEDED